jgi:RecA/RadA recombinase
MTRIRCSLMLSTDFGFTGTGELAKQALSGQYIHSGDDVHYAVRLVLDHLKQTAEMANQTSHPTISDDAFSGKLNVWRESTSTSPSGLHLGHYKSLIARHQYSEVDQHDNETLSRQVKANWI